MRIFSVILFVVLLTACDSDLNQEVKDLKEENSKLEYALNVTQFRNQLLFQHQNGILIREVTSNEVSDSILISYENDYTLVAAAEWLKSYSLEAENWNCEFAFEADKIDCKAIGIINISDDQVQLNPNSIAPLSALATFKTIVENKIKVTVLGKGNTGIPISNEFSAYQTENEIPILGLYADYDNQVVVDLLSEDGVLRTSDTLIIKTEPLPELLPSIVINKCDRTKMEEGQHFSGYISSRLSNKDGGKEPIFFDDEGEIRWFLRVTQLLPEGLQWSSIERLKNGNLYIGQAQSIMEMDMIGNVVNEWNYSSEYDFNHSVYEKETDGNFLACVSLTNNETIDYKGEAVTTVGDLIIEINRETGDIVKEWDLREVLDVDRDCLNLFGTPSDWAHLNSIWYDESDDCIVASIRNQGVIKLTQNNELVWIMAPHYDWGLAGAQGEGPINTSDYLLTAIDATGNAYNENVQLGIEDTDNFDWVWGQHAAMMLSNGNLLVFNNGNRTGAGETSFVMPDTPYSSAVEYKIDIAHKTVSQVWAYGKSRGAASYSPFISDVDLGQVTGNRFFMPGIINYNGQTYAEFIEVTTDGECVFDAKIIFPGSFGGVFRSERMPIYPNVL